MKQIEKQVVENKKSAQAWARQAGAMNLTVLTPDENLASVAKPQLEVVSKLRLCPEDWLVVCGGFEDRALGVLEKAVSEAVPFNVLLVNYRPVFKENRAALIRNVCQRAGIQPTEMAYDRQEPSGFGNIVAEKLAECRGRVIVDVSAMSRLLIVQILVALGSRQGGFLKSFVAYAEAERYAPSEAEAQTALAKSESDPTFPVLFLSSGVYQVTLVPELTSFAPAGAQTRLVVFPCLDAHHLTALRAEIQPSRFTFIEGVPPQSQNRWRQKLIADVNRLDTIRDAERCHASTLDYRETLDCLFKLYAAHAVQERLLISPTGSKMQTVAVGIFRSFVEDVQIVYPTPRGFRKPDAYTFGVGPLHLLPLEAFSAAGPS